MEHTVICNMQYSFSRLDLCFINLNSLFIHTNVFLAQIHATNLLRLSCKTSQQMLGVETAKKLDFKSSSAEITTYMYTYYLHTLTYYKFFSYSAKSILDDLCPKKHEHDFFQVRIYHYFLAKRGAGVMVQTLHALRF